MYYCIRFSPKIRQALIEHTMKDPSKECGGFVYGKVWRTENGVMCDIDAIYYEDKKGTNNRFVFTPSYIRNGRKAAWKLEGMEFMGTYHSHGEYPARFSKEDRESLQAYFGRGKVTLIYSPKHKHLIGEFMDMDGKSYKAKLLSKK
ncbi:MAG: Mov34/MPN/PAD-1 family protein [Bacilli bacterium]|nr:Mov34/MPN/PAD-1 family protein [Bacilli bacterium]